MADEYENIDPMTADDMRTNADYFEEVSIAVQNAAEDDDQVCLSPSAPRWHPVVHASDGAGRVKQQLSIPYRVRMSSALAWLSLALPPCKSAKSELPKPHARALFLPDHPPLTFYLMARFPPSPVRLYLLRIPGDSVDESRLRAPAMARHGAH